MRALLLVVSSLGATEDNIICTCIIICVFVSIVLYYPDRVVTSVEKQQVYRAQESIFPESGVCMCACMQRVTLYIVLSVIHKRRNQGEIVVAFKGCIVQSLDIDSTLLI